MATLTDDKQSLAEAREIERHKYYLSERAGCDVGFEFAARDWRERYGQQFREHHQAYMLNMQREEIARHTWIESEKAGCDLGRAAALDWVKKYAAHWRDWYNHEYGPAN